jgi:hypothetical protein
MSKLGNVQNVGAPDPEARNSPIFDESDADYQDVDPDEGEGICYFNSQAFDIGAYICSGEELLRCEGHGVWIREGACYEK